MIEHSSIYTQERSLPGIFYNLKVQKIDSKNNDIGATRLFQMQMRLQLSFYCIDKFVMTHARIKNIFRRGGGGPGDNLFAMGRGGIRGLYIRYFTS